jgi:hypothetical protein
VVCLVLVVQLGASFTPKSIGQWFGLHVMSVVMVILVSEPIKCLWYLDFGWRQPSQ